MVLGIVFVAVILALFNYGLYKFLNHSWEQGKPLEYKNAVKLTGKTVLITGANCGLGKSTALDLAARGARLILACRNKEKAEAAAEEIKRETGNEDVSVVILDLSDLDSVKAAADTVIEKYNRLDVLINNAGIGLNDQKVTKQGFEMIFGTNHVGHFLFTQLLLDLLKKSAPSRIINVSSNALWAVWNKLDYQLTSEHGTVKFPKLQGYPISKLANYFHVLALANELKGTRVTANAVHPGIVKTEIAKRNNEVKMKAFLNKIFSGLSVIFGRSAKDGCQTIVYIAADPELEDVTGEYFSNLNRTTDELTKFAKDKEEAEKLSKFSYEMCRDYLPARLSVDKDTSGEKMEDKKDEQETKEESLFVKPTVAALETEPEEIRACSLSDCPEKLEDESPSAPPDNPSKEASPFNDDDITTPLPTTEEERSTPIVDN